MFSSVIESGINIYSASICFITAIVLGLIISYLNMKTNKYSKNMSISLAVLPLLVSVVIIMVNGNLGTGVAILGAFSLIRFRSVPGNSREIVSVFFSMAVGLAIGMGCIGYATLTTLIGGIFIYILAKSKFGEKQERKLLRITIPEDLDYSDIFDDIFEKYLNEYTLDRVKSINLGSLFELTYTINLKENEKQMIDEIRVRNGNLKISIERCQDEDEL